MNYPIYCEQAKYAGYFEPWNTVTNLTFIIAGIILLVNLKRSKQLDAKAIFLSSVLIIIGIGSLAWHLYRNNLTLTADSIPIAVFVLSYLFFYLKYTCRKTLHLILLFFGFFIYTPLLTWLLNPDSSEIFGNGGAMYFSAITYLLVIQIYNYYNMRSIIKKSMIIIIVFLISLTFRQANLFLCNNIHFGTHFMWHILNGLSLYLMVLALYPKKEL